jgi:hypothetical protein
MRVSAPGQNRLILINRAINEQSLLVIIIATLYGIAIASYISFVHLAYKNSYYGYMNTQVAPGTATFVDRRISYYWVLSIISICRILLLIVSFLVADFTKYSGWLFSFHRKLSVFYIIFDLLYFFSLLFFSGNCNSILFPNNPCNSVDICASYGDSWTSLCRTNSFTGTSVRLLPLTLAFTLDFIIIIVFFVLDIVQQSITNNLRKVIKRSL